MAQVGNLSNYSWAGWIEHGFGWMLCSQFTMPAPGGYASGIHAFFDTFSGSGAIGAMGVWNASTGHMYAATGTFIINNASAPSTPGGQEWWVHTGFSHTEYIPGGVSILIGCWSNQNISASSGTGGSSKQYNMGTGGLTDITVGSLASTGIGELGVYMDYTPAGVHVRRSGVWVVAPVYVRRSGVWAPAQLKVRRSGAWVTPS